jgi:ABC-type transport system involved in cytochrome bd biosynthesis fused ATPase/permease subunit
MKKILAFLAYTGLALTLLPSLLVFHGSLSTNVHKQLMLAGAMIWFIAAPLWFRKSRELQS